MSALSIVEFERMLNFQSLKKRNKQTHFSNIKTFLLLIVKIWVFFADLKKKKKFLSNEIAVKTISIKYFCVQKMPKFVGISGSGDGVNQSGAIWEI